MVNSLSFFHCTNWLLGQYWTEQNKTWIALNNLYMYQIATFSNSDHLMVALLTKEQLTTISNVTWRSVFNLHNQMQQPASHKCREWQESSRVNNFEQQFWLHFTILNPWILTNQKYIISADTDFSSFGWKNLTGTKLVFIQFTRWQKFDKYQARFNLNEMQWSYLQMQLKRENWNGYSQRCN